MASKQTLQITILSCGGMSDLMSEQEANFLNSALGLFRNVPSYGRGTPRAQPVMVRVYRPSEAKNALQSCNSDIVHLIAHGGADSKGAFIAVGPKRLYAKELLKAHRQGGGLALPEVVISTVCEFDNAEWQSTLKTLGVKVLVASTKPVTPANLAAFDMAFYSALLSRVYRSKTTVDRVAGAFSTAKGFYKDIHAKGTPKAPFALQFL